MNSMNVITSRTDTSILEPLEPRIAPATLVVGAGGDNYDDAPFVSTASVEADPAIADLFESSEDHYYLFLGKGDKVLFDDGGGEAFWFSVNNGVGYFFFHDANGDGIVQQDELTGISVGGKSSLTIDGDVNGFILTNVDAGGGFLGETLESAGKSFIASLDVSGNIEGEILSGGKVDKVTVGGSAGGVAVGTATTFGEFYLGGIGETPGAGFLGVFAMGDKQSGDGISRFSAASVGYLAASDGGASGGGGDVTKITLTGQSDDLQIMAGNGGDGTASTINGGNGGKISKVDIAFDPSATEGGMLFSGGLGGDAFFDGDSKAGKGGAGGHVDNVIIGMQSSGKGFVPAEDLAEFALLVEAGGGGEGKFGGSGGKLQNIHAATMDSVILMYGGNGGEAMPVSGAKAGHGGDLMNITAISLTMEESSQSAALLVAGSASGDLPEAKGGNGGQIKAAALDAREILIESGVGSDGSQGGHGGNISKITAGLGYSALEGLLIQTGRGGDGFLKNGGHGGSVQSLAISNLAFMDSLDDPPEGWMASGFSLFLEAGSGGSGAHFGGHGGSISKLDIALTSGEFAAEADTEVFFLIKSGAGGAGENKGGNGGSLGKSTITAEPGAGFDFAAFGGGAGGDLLGAKGKAGAGGSISGLDLHLNGEGGAAFGFELQAGFGGNAAGDGKGGHGGQVTGGKQGIELLNIADSYLAAGNGGDADTGIAGAGGAVSKLALHLEGDALFEVLAGFAGDAVEPSKGANGGSISKLELSGEQVEYQLVAGSGSGGGHGGSVSNIGPGKLIGVEVPGDPVQYELSPSLFDLVVLAGNGSEGAKSSGHGGDISKISLVTPGEDYSFRFTAGSGGDGERPGNGGTVQNVDIFDQSKASVFDPSKNRFVNKIAGVPLVADGGTVIPGAVEITTGDGGDSTSSANGGNGGNARNIFWDVDGLTRALVLGTGGTSVGGNPGADGQAKNVVPLP